MIIIKAGVNSFCLFLYRGADVSDPLTVTLIKYFIYLQKDGKIVYGCFYSFADVKKEYVL